MKENLINRIIDKELEMFLRVSNIGGQASCQRETDNFKTMRNRQWEVWPLSGLESYFSDLEKAQLEGRNLLTEKYAYMMESTMPLEYEKIKDQIPTISPLKLNLIEDILKIQLKWKEDLLIKYPNLSLKGRPLYKREDSPNSTSFETYMKGELKTYSVNTLKIYLKHLIKEKSEGINEAELILENTVKYKGYKSLNDANESLRPK